VKRTAERVRSAGSVVRFTDFWRITSGIPSTEVLGYSQSSASRTEAEMTFCAKPSHTYEGKRKPGVALLNRL
jgi:hypothetical protein